MSRQLGKIEDHPDIRVSAFQLNLNLIVPFDAHLGLGIWIQFAE